MRFDVNLASRPFVNHVPHFLLLASLAVLAVGLSAWNLTRFMSTRSEARAVGGQLAELDRREAELGQREAALRERIAGTNLEALREDVILADSVLSEKAVAWAELLERLEDLMPWKAALRSIRTSTSPRGVTIDMDLQAQDQERYLQFIESLEGSPCFTSVYPARETRLESGQFAVSLSADYDPTCSAAASGQQASAAPAGAQRRRRG